jgi:hypothetical protein
LTSTELDGKLVVFQHGSREVQMHGEMPTISLPIRVLGHRDLAPLSLTEHMTGRRFARTIPDEAPVGRLRGKAECSV